MGWIDQWKLRRTAQRRRLRELDELDQKCLIGHTKHQHEELMERVRRRKAMGRIRSIHMAKAAVKLKERQ